MTSLNKSYYKKIEFTNGSSQQVSLGLQISDQVIAMVLAVARIVLPEA
jgi:hypothetical protein